MAECCDVYEIYSRERGISRGHLTNANKTIDSRRNIQIQRIQILKYYSVMDNIFWNQNSFSFFSFLRFCRARQLQVRIGISWTKTTLVLILNSSLISSTWRNIWLNIILPREYNLLLFNHNQLQLILIKDFLPFAFCGKAAEN